ncbi:hypothetical protein [Rhizobium paknamense]|uniref:Four helix bundle protein n=1 Tax=Rhizobium paknamense TaxID=1206817 RepID=A0ABU0ICX5_9HYPH|nr:hypothetical protein [Rhizobium paknamense]MDQ0456092.1 hypothetical protein [Rhizobium paknamense]
MKSFTLGLAPQKLWQAINPWTYVQQGVQQVGLINISLGSTPSPETEQDVLDEVGSYGRQIGRISEALEVLIRHVPLEKLSEDETHALNALKAQVSSVRRIKQRHGRR